MKIVPVSDRDGLAEFVEFPWTVHRGDRLWIPPLREQVFHELSEASAFARYGRSQLYLCEADGQVAGRIAALVNPRLVDGAGRIVGQLGYFESLDDPLVASALIEAGLNWLGAQGAREVVAPMNGGAHRTHRFLTRGFDREPYLFEPRNPPHYPKLFERCGFAAINRWYGYELSRQQAVDRLHQFDRVLARRPPPGRIEELQTGRAPETIARVHRLLDRCWAGHVGYASLDIDEFAEVFGGALAIMGPGHVSAFVNNEEDVGVAFILPDYAAEMRALDGRAAGWGHWLGTSRPTRIVLHTAALVPEIRHTSAAMAQIAWGLRRAVKDGFDDVVFALVVEDFLQRIGEQTREHTLYARPLR
jgi:hypothetical protein